MKSCIFFLMLAFVACAPGSQIGFSKTDHKQIAVQKTSFQRFSYIMDFNVQRLSNARVHLSWHIDTGKVPLRCQLFRKIGKDGTLQPLKNMEIQYDGNGIADYSHTDRNVYADSTYYAIMLEDEKGTKFFSKLIGVGGAGK